MGWLKAVWSWVRRLPVARYIKPLWKAGLKALIQQEGDVLQERLDGMVAAKGPEVIGGLIDQFTRAVRAGFRVLPLPAAFEGKVIGFVEEHAAALKESLPAAVASGGVAAMDAKYDELQAVLIARVDAL